MPLTNAEKQKRARDKRNSRMARYDAALRRIVDQPEGVQYDLARDIAASALNPQT